MDIIRNNRSVNQSPINNLARETEKGGKAGECAKGDEMGYIGAVTHWMLTPAEKVKSKSQCIITGNT